MAGTAGRRWGLGGRWRIAIWGVTATCVVGCGKEPRREAAARRDTTRAAPEIPSFAAVELDSIPPVAAAQLTPEQRRGGAVYNTRCWSCHGLYGHGDGPVARGYPDPLPDLGRIAAAQPVDVTAARMRRQPTGAGPSSAEPVWHDLGAADMRAVVAYIKSFAPPGSLGNPAGGRLIYATYCVHCHGVRGAGDGHLAPTLPRRPVDLRTSDLADHPNRVFAQLRVGGAPEHGKFMPNWGRVFNDQQLWDLIAYLEVLQAHR